MTQPDQMRWEKILEQAIGAKPVERAVFADRPWFRLSNSQVWRNEDAKPWNDPIPQSTGDGKFTVYRKSYTVRTVNGQYSYNTNFQMLEFSVDFFAKGDGDRSPYDNYNRDWVTNFNDSLVQMNNVLDENTIFSAANAYDNALGWFTAASERLKPWIDDVNTEASGFQGSAAEAFRHQVLNLEYGFNKYGEQLTTPQTWSTLLTTAGYQAASFKRNIQRLWQGYMGLPSPRDVIVSVLKQIEQQVDSWDKQMKWGDGRENLIPPDWSWEFLLKVGDNTTMYNLADPSHIAALDFMMRWSWANQVVEFLDRPGLNAFTPLNSTIEAVHTASAQPITLFEYPRRTPTPNNPNNPNNPNLPPPPPNGGGSNGNLPPPPRGGGGSDGNLPPPPRGEGGSNGNLPPPPTGGGGSNGNLPPLGGGGGSGGNLPPLGGEGGSNGNPPPTTFSTTGGGGGSNGNIPPLPDLTNTGGSGGPGGPPQDLNISGGGSGGGLGLPNLLAGPPDADGTGGFTGVAGPLGLPLGPNSGGSAGGTNGPNGIDQLTGGVNGSGTFDDFTEPNAGGDDPDRALGGPLSGLGDLPTDVRTIDSIPGGGSEAQGIVGTGIPSLDNPPEGLPLPLEGGSSGLQFPDGSPVGAAPGSSSIGGLSSGGGGLDGLGGPGDDWELQSPAGGPAGSGGPVSGGSGGSDFSQLGENAPGGLGTSGPNGGFDATGLPIGDPGSTGGDPGSLGAPGPAPGQTGTQPTGVNSPMGGMGGMPFMPPMGGPGLGHGGPENKDRERSTWLTEDERVWGTDPDCAPAVIGRDDSADFDLIEHGDWERVPAESSQPATDAKPATPASPDSPTAPSRAR